MTFGEWLLQSRFERNLTQREVAELISISTSILSRYERGMAFPSQETLHKIEVEFGFSPVAVNSTVSKRLGPKGMQFAGDHFKKSGLSRRGMHHNNVRYVNG